MRTHAWFPICKGISFMFCGRCGLINLKNKVSIKAANSACKGHESEDGS